MSPVPQDYLTGGFMPARRSLSRRSAHVCARRLSRMAARGQNVIDDANQPGRAGTAASPRAQKAIRSMRAGMWRETR